MHFPVRSVLRFPRARFVASAVLAAALGLTLQPLHAVPLAAQELGIKVGAVAPGAPIETLEGSTIDLGTLLKGKPTVLEFWATWCGNCKQLEPAMVSAYGKYKDRAQFVAIAVSLNQTVERVKDYRTRFKLPFTFLYDRRGDASEAYDAPATSYVVIVNAAGRVVYTGVGGAQDLDAAIAKALAGS
jgi:thiol-disulfide isomerase/thioredoxin